MKKAALFIFSLFFLTLFISSCGSDGETCNLLKYPIPDFSSEDIDGDGFTVAEGDCNDYDSSVYPGADEPCCPPSSSNPDLCDKNCDSIASPCSALDEDNDGFSAALDCNDNDPSIYPGAPDKCGDGIDQDCVSGDVVCSEIEDKDSDGYHVGIDCNDNNADIYPGAQEKCNYLDNNCDGIIDDGNPGGGVTCADCSDFLQPGVSVCMHNTSTYEAGLYCLGAIEADE